MTHLVNGDFVSGRRIQDDDASVRGADEPAIYRSVFAGFDTPTQRRRKDRVVGFGRGSGDLILTRSGGPHQLGTGTVDIAKWHAIRVNCIDLA